MTEPGLSNNSETNATGSASYQAAHALLRHELGSADKKRAKYIDNLAGRATLCESTTIWIAYVTLTSGQGQTKTAV